MKNKRSIYILLIFLVFMLTISAVSAADDTSSDINGIDNNDEFILDSQNDGSILNNANEELILDDNDDEILDDSNENPVGQSNEDAKLSEETGTFTDLNNDINGNDDTEISLNKNYVFDPETDSAYQTGINIKRTVTINGNGITIDGNNLARIFHLTANDIIIKNISFINGRIEDSVGVGIWIDGGNDCSVSDCTFINNTANDASAILCYGNGVNISNCVFINNTALNEKTSGGGAITLYGYGGSFSNCTFINNNAKFGGAIQFYYCSATISDSTFINNSASQTGGAIYIEEVSGSIYGGENNYLIVDNCTFENNSAGMDGGAISIYFTANCSVSNCNFIKNNADDGGAIMCDALSNNSISNCNFTENEAYEGGAIYWISNNGSLSNCKFTSNKAEYNGGAVYWHFDDGSLTGSIFENNTAESGGAIQFYESSATISDSSFINNSASQTGGAINKGNAINCNFTNNTASNGGAINKGNAINCEFESNEAESDGGAIKEGNAINCNFTNNTATNGGAIKEGNAINCNFTNNSAELGQAMYEGIAVKCTFRQNENWETKVYETATLKTSDYTSVYNSGDSLEIELIGGEEDEINGVTTKITVYQNDEEVGTFYGKTGEGWEVSLKPGEYTAIISIEELPEIASVDASLKISKASTSLTSYDASFEFNTTRQFVVVTLRDGYYKAISGAILNIQIDGTNKTDMTDQNGEIRISPRNLAMGSHTVTITLNENENYIGSTSTSIMTITQSHPLIDYVDYVGNYGSDDEIVITLYDHEVKAIKGVNVTVDIDGEKKFTTDNKGQIKVPVKELTAGLYKAIFTFDGNENYTAAYQKFTVDIAKLTSQIIYENMTTTAVDVDTDGRIGKNFTITLKDSKGNALANKAVQIGFNGKVYDRVTDKDGKANLQINLKNAGTYTFAICFLGDENYNGSFAVAKILVNKQKGSLTVPNKSYKASASTKSLTATFKSASGKVVANKKITFTVNGKTYSATTNDKGVATVKVSLNKKGTYSFTAKFAGNNMYAAISKTAKLTIK